MEVLAVNVEQQFAQRLELRQGHSVAVDECARSTVGIDDAPQQALAVEFQRLFFEPG